LRIIDDILEISNLETKQEKLSETEFSLNDLFMEIFSIFDLQAKERNIPIYLKKGLHDDQSYILTDKTKLNKVIGNLIENAIKYTNEGFIEVGYYIENGYLKIYVKDTGIGIAPENNQLIFERFSQEDKEISKKHGGLGLGLSISKENAQLLGGDITLESEKGKGATFYLTIPYKSAQNSEAELDQKSTQPLKGAGYTILVAEDEEVNYLYIEALFEDEFEGDCNLVHAKNGKEAVDICLKNKDIQVVMMDIKMPEMNGHEATKIIKEKLPDLPIIALTAYSTDEFVSKPNDEEKLFQLIKKYLNVKSEF
jgi:CheY-like chemotaxis protein/anti-sigma regulatory factor (Ser/Thr protein kinase)